MVFVQPSFFLALRPQLQWQPLWEFPAATKNARADLLKEARQSHGHSTQKRPQSKALTDLAISRA